jgi:hypothetical protein
LAPPGDAGAPLEIALTWSASERTLSLASDGAGSDLATLDDDSARAIIDRASEVAAAVPVRITVNVPGGGATHLGELQAAISTHFARRKDAAAHALRRTMRAGWMSLAIASALLVVLISVVEAIRRFAPDGRLARVLQEGLTIVGWVALWRPLELLLYDRWLLRRDVALLRRLARADVRVVERRPANPVEPSISIVERRSDGAG